MAHHLWLLGGTASIENSIHRSYRGWTVLHPSYALDGFAPSLLEGLGSAVMSFGQCNLHQTPRASLPEDVDTTLVGSARHCLH